MVRVNPNKVLSINSDKENDEGDSHETKRGKSCAAIFYP